jgi:phosphomannomutase
MHLPKLQVTGYRGIWGESLNEQIAFEYARAYAKMISAEGERERKVLIGRDARPSGPKIFSSLRAALEKEGVQVANAGIIPTPSVLLLVKKLGLAGGIMITASHNPLEYNGIKFVVAGGRLTNESEVKQIENFREKMSEAEKKLPPALPAEVETLDNQEFRRIHIQEIIENVDAYLIRRKQFRVALDPVNGAGAVIAPELLDELGCEVNLINAKQDGTFAHPPEPLPENLGQVAEKTKRSGADIGFALDPDADRLVAIDETGKVVGEEHTLVLLIKNILEKEPGDIVINIASSRMSEDVAGSYGRKTFRVKVGEANVLQKMIEIGAPVGGEGGGGGIYPKINASRDGLVCMTLILELMARENKKISKIVEELPKYFMKKEKIPVRDNAQELYDKLKIQFPEAGLSEIDGVRFDWPDTAWLSVRASITEPIIRIFGEAKTEERINSIFSKARLTLGSK